MKRILTVIAFTLISGLTALQAQISFGQTFVPRYTEGNTPTNNDRIPFWFWAEITGLTPGATYRFYSTLDSANASPSSNGAGNPLVINMNSGTVRRVTTATLGNVTGHDSLVADNTGAFAGWFGVEPTGNGRFMPGMLLYPKIMLNNGAGGTSVATRLLLSNDTVKVLNFGTTSGSGTQGSALYDSINAPAKNFVALYNNVTLPARPLSIGIIENEGLDQFAITSYSNFYRNLVDTLTGHYGAIIPNANADGIRYAEVRSFSGNLQTMLLSDDNGIWCSGLNTINPAWGNTGSYLNSSFTLTTSATIPDTTYTSQTTFFYSSSNDPNATYTWDFGDASTGTGANTTHTYANPGTVMVQLIISNGGCSDTIIHSVVVELGTFIPRVPTLWFGITPNPALGEFMISTNENNEKTVTVLNLLGETVAVKSMNGNSMLMDLKDQQPGIYFVRIKDEVTGRYGLKKVVLQ